MGALQRAKNWHGFCLYAGMDIETQVPEFFSARVRLHQNLVTKLAKIIDSQGESTVTESGLLALIDAAMSWPAPVCDAPDSAFARHAAAMMRSAMIAAMLQPRGRHVTTRQT